MHIKKGDLVTVRSGDDKGKTAKVILALPRENKIVVEGVNVMKKHQRATASGKKGSLIEVAMPMSVSNVVKSGESKETKAEPKKSQGRSTESVAAKKATKK